MHEIEISPVELGKCNSNLTREVGDVAMAGRNRMGENSSNFISSMHSIDVPINYYNI